MYTNANGLVGNGKELQSKDRVDKNKLDIIGIGETKRGEDIKA